MINDRYRKGLTLYKNFLQPLMKLQRKGGIRIQSKEKV
jgi:hypothetical protein